MKLEKIFHVLVALAVLCGFFCSIWLLIEDPYHGSIVIGAWILFIALCGGFMLLLYRLFCAVAGRRF